MSLSTCLELAFGLLHCESVIGFTSSYVGVFLERFGVLLECHAAAWAIISASPGVVMPITGLRYEIPTFDE